MRLPSFALLALAALFTGCSGNDVGCGEAGCAVADGDSDTHGDGPAPDVDPPDELVVGPLTVTDAGADLTFTIPAGIVSWTLTLSQPTPTEARLGITLLTAPDGTVLFDAASEVSLNPTLDPYPGAASIMLPVSDDPRAQPVAGDYTARFGLFTTADNITFTGIPGSIGRAAVRWTRARGQTLSLRIAWTPQTGLDATAPFFTDAFDQVRDIYEGLAGLTVATPTFATLPGTIDSLSTAAAVHAACAANSVVDGIPGAVNVFVISNLAFAGGVAGGVPGPPGLGATAASCIVIEKQSSAIATGALMAHEIGHFLGLFHTTQLDFDGETYHLAGHDPLSDTPECGIGTALEACGDYHNLMFPFFPTTNLTLSPAQIDVLRRSPWVTQRATP